jgi:outer membrane protein assembly factor BamB
LTRHLNTAWLVLLFLTLLVSRLHGEDWPRFRGPNGTGVSGSEGLPGELGPETNVIWGADSGDGSSSPVIARGRLYFTSFEGDVRTVHCLDAATGKPIWSRSVEKARTENASRPNGPATCTPAAGGESLVVLFPDAGLFCYSASGTERWRVDVGPFHSMHGIAASPVIEGNKVLLLADQLRGSFLAAYDLATGELAWKQERLDGLTGAYSTPAVFTLPGGAAHVVASGPGELCGYLVATGQKAWSAPGLTNSPVSVPVVSGNRVFVCEPVGKAESISMLAPLDANKDGRLSLEEAKASVPMFRLLERMDTDWGNGDGVVEVSEWDEAFAGFVNKGGLVAVELEDAGDAVKPRVQWSYLKTVPYVASPLVYEDVLYLAQDGGIVTTVDPKSGEILKRGRLKQGAKKFYASPVAADGKVFLLDTAGQMTVLRAGAQWEQLATAALGEPCFATPAICDARLYIRTQRKIYCFGKSP